MARAPNPFARPSASPDNPDVLSINDYRESGSAVTTASASPPLTATASGPTVAPKPLPPPEMEEKKIRVSVKLTAAEHWELKKRIAASNMGVDEYLRTLLFPSA